MSPVVIDGGNLGCAALLLRLNHELRALPGGTEVRVITTDPAAPIDLPAWCHLTGHACGGPAPAGGRPGYLITVSAAARPIRADQPWRPADRPDAGHRSQN
jgi:tRNA 2-thiouridine synthesizing protein A